MDLRRLRWQYGGPKVAMAVALALPFLPWWLWSLAAGVLLVTWSWLAFLAVAAGLTVRYPWTAALWLAAGLCVAALWRWTRLLEWTPRGDSPDPIRGRWTGIQLACLRLTWRGHGPGSMARDLRRWTSRGVPYLPTDVLLCEPVQLCYEYGALGALLLGGIAWAVFSLVTWGGIWSSFWISLGVLSLGHAPVWYASRWMARRFRRLVPNPPLLADVTIHVTAEGAFRFYTDAQKTYTPEQAAVIAEAIMRAATYLAEQHGFRIDHIEMEART